MTPAGAGIDPHLEPGAGWRVLQLCVGAESLGDRALAGLAERRSGLRGEHLPEIGAQQLVPRPAKEPLRGGVEGGEAPVAVELADAVADARQHVGRVPLGDRQLSLGRALAGDVLQPVDEALRAAVVIAHQRGVEEDRDGLPIPAQAAQLRLVGGDVAPQRVLRQDEAGLQIVRMRDVLDVGRQEIRFSVAEQGATGGVDLEDAAIRPRQRDGDGGPRKERLEAPFTHRQRVGDGVAGCDVAANRRHSDHLPGGIADRGDFQGDLKGGTIAGAVDRVVQRDPFSSPHAGEEGVASHPPALGAR